jgi:reverse gyrase
MKEPKCSYCGGPISTIRLLAGHHMFCKDCMYDNHTEIMNILKNGSPKPSTQSRAERCDYISTTGRRCMLEKGHKDFHEAIYYIEEKQPAEEQCTQ